MVFGTFSFLEIRTHIDNHFIAHEYLPNEAGSDGNWMARDLTKNECTFSETVKG
jgi:hypothetical protein